MKGMKALSILLSILMICTTCILPVQAATVDVQRSGDVCSAVTEWYTDDNSKYDHYFFDALNGMVMVEMLFFSSRHTIMRRIMIL